MRWVRGMDDAMDMKQLTTFVTLAQTLNYQKAAEQLQYAPSTLFKHIQLLEQELGAELFCKAGRQLQLTEKGGCFLEHAQRILHDYHVAMSSLTGEEHQAYSLTIGGCEINTGNSLLRLLTQYTQNHPQVRMNMLTSPNANVPTLVKNDLIDLGFYYSIGEKGVPGLKTIRLYQEPVYLLTAKSHPLAGRKGLKYEDLRGVPFVYPHDSCCFVAQLLPILRSRGVELGKITYLGSVLLVTEHVHAGHALTLMPHCAVDRFCRANDMAVLDLDEAPILAWEMIVYRSFESLRTPARELLGYSCEYAKRLLRSDSALLSGEEWDMV